MPVPFIDRAPTQAETEIFRLLMSCFCDGSGNLKAEGCTLPDWRQLERVVAEALNGVGPENKDVFDVVVQSPDHGGSDFGFSVKSKELSRVGAIGDLATTGRVYMELCNSPAKLWDPLKRKGITEEDFRNQQNPEIVGQEVLNTVVSWKHQAANDWQRRHNRTLDLNRSVYLTISYSKPRPDRPREYQFHSFDLPFPQRLSWYYISDRCLRAEDPLYPGEVIFDWYGLSGGQLKYYPRATTARYSSSRFTLLNAQSVSLSRKAATLWPQEWTNAGGEIEFTRNELIDILEKYVIFVAAGPERDILLNAIERLR
jgi:hypothetical protein